MIKRLRLLLLALLLGSLLGCASQTQPIQYYLLHSPEDAKLLATDKPVTTVWLQNIAVSDYLGQRGLPLQTKQNVLHLSTQHMWAEPFESGFEKLLSHHLAPQYQVVDFDLRNTARYTLSVSLLHLVATFKGEVVISAQYQLSKQNDNVTQYQFHARYPLQQDGYDHAITVYRQAIEALAADIKTHLATR